MYSFEQFSFQLGNLNFLALQWPIPSRVLMANASATGWEGCLECLSVSDIWESPWLDMHITVLELRAILFSLSHFVFHLQSDMVKVLSDSTRALCCLRNLTSSVVMSQVQQILSLCRVHSVTIAPVHIPDQLNVRADALSRTSPVYQDPTEFASCNNCFITNNSTVTEKFSHGFLPLYSEKKKK